ncbi:MAG: NeuD/PglB/VioB family sugar acetyltransferase [Candidatus Omnitrophica bacterium]|nr:NeuD/PglB/VioB family sugar acetyltransferase [Candidatus Omnitrophota bacterium]
MSKQSLKRSKRSEDLILFPFGGNSREALGVVRDINKAGGAKRVIGFIDDNKALWGTSYEETPVLGGRDYLKKFPGARVLAVPGNPENYITRKNAIDNLKISETRFTTVIHPRAVVAENAVIGCDTLIMANVVIGPDVRIGKHCIILPNSVISHDSVIGDYTCVGAGVVVSGNVSIGGNCYIASGSLVCDHVSIGERSLVGLGANVIDNVGKGLVVAGNPARVLRNVE